MFDKGLQIPTQDLFKTALSERLQKRHEQSDGGVIIAKGVGPAIATILMAQILFNVFFAEDVRLGELFQKLVECPA